jgi:type IX secretion system PorP/SprF family membrane protein
MFTQFNMNDYILNPALGGVHDYYQVKTTYRQQWVGFDGSPTSYMISTYGPHATMDMGYGGYLFSDQVGPIQNLGIYGSYAYNFQIMNDIRLSLGLFVGAVQLKFEPLDLKENGDPLNEPKSTFHPDASFGAYVYTPQWDVGFSANQLFFSRIDDAADTTDNVVSRLTSHFYLTGRYRYNINRDIDLEGAAWLKYVTRVTPQFDINVRGIYQKMFWGGIGYRTGDAVSIMLGYNQGLVMIGYSYDIITSNIRTYSSGTHEVVIGVRFSSIKSSSRSRRSIR